MLVHIFQKEEIRKRKKEKKIDHPHVQEKLVHILKKKKQGKKKTKGHLL